MCRRFMDVNMSHVAASISHPKIINRTFQPWKTFIRLLK